MSGDGWILCVLPASEVEAQRDWLRDQEKRIVRRNPDGSIVLRFRASELRKAPE